MTALKIDHVGERTTTAMLTKKQNLAEAAVEMEAHIARVKKMHKKVSFGALGSLLGTPCFALLAQTLFPVLAAPIAIAGAVVFCCCGIACMADFCALSEFKGDLKRLTEKLGQVTEQSRCNVEQLQVEWEVIEKQGVQREEERLELERQHNPMLAGTGLTFVEPRPEDIDALMREATAEQEQMRFPGRAGVPGRYYIPLPRMQ